MVELDNVLSLKQKVRSLIEQGCDYQELIEHIKESFPEIKDKATLMKYLKQEPATATQHSCNKKAQMYLPYKETLTALVTYGETIPNIAMHLNLNSRYMSSLLASLGVPVTPLENPVIPEPLTKDQWEAVVNLSLEGYCIKQIQEELPMLTIDQIAWFCLEYYVPYSIVEEEKIERQFTKKENDIYALYLAGHTQAAIGKRYDYAQSYVSRILKSAKAIEQTKGLRAFYALEEEDYYTLFDKYLDKMEWADAITQIANIYNLPNKWISKILTLKGIGKSGYIKNMKFSKSVFEKCIQEGMSQVQIAEHLGIDQGTVSRYCTKYNLTTTHAHTKVIGSPLETQIIEMLHDNKTCYQVAKELDCAYATVLKIGKANNLAFDRNIYICNTETEQYIIEALKQGIPKMMIAEAYNCSYNTVYKIAKKHNLTRTYNKKS